MLKGYNKSEKKRIICNSAISIVGVIMIVVSTLMMIIKNDFNYIFAVIGGAFIIENFMDEIRIVKFEAELRNKESKKKRKENGK